MGCGQHVSRNRHPGWRGVTAADPGLWGETASRLRNRCNSKTNRKLANRLPPSIARRVTSIYCVLVNAADLAHKTFACHRLVVGAVDFGSGKKVDGFGAGQILAGDGLTYEKSPADCGGTKAVLERTCCQTNQAGIGDLPAAWLRSTIRPIAARFCVEGYGTLWGGQGRFAG